MRRGEGRGDEFIDVCLSPLLYSEPVFCPHVVLPQASLRVKAMLQHQPWNLEYSLDPSEYDPPITPKIGMM